jgi:hypothetical protein
MQIPHAVTFSVTTKIRLNAFYRKVRRFQDFNSVATSKQPAHQMVEG